MAPSPPKNSTARNGTAEVERAETGKMRARDNGGLVGDRAARSPQTESRQAHRPVPPSCLEIGKRRTLFLITQPTHLFTGSTTSLPHGDGTKMLTFLLQAPRMRMSDHANARSLACNARSPRARSGPGVPSSAAKQLMRCVHFPQTSKLSITSKY